MALQPHELTIRILNADNNGGGSSNAPSPTTSGGKAVNTSKGVIESSLAARELTSIARQATSFAVSTVGLTTGNTVSQERIQFGMSAATKVAAYGTAIATGNIPAAAIMAINDTINIAVRSAQIALQNQVERESLAFSRDRAGIAFNQSRMGGAK